MTRYRTRSVTPPPVAKNTAQARGHALSYFLDQNKIPVAAFAASIQRDRTYVHRIFRGEVDLADLDQTEASLIIQTLGVYDTDARELLGIPESAWSNWRTFRPPPFGEGQTTRETIPVHLKDHPLKGEASLPAGITLHVLPGDNDRPIQIVLLPDGRYYSTTPSMLEHIAGKHIGGLVSIDV
ncbi:hypothetical protein BXU09_19505 [Deinococcus sp. LM3]|nr:hypothetical protein BXU09_19505 [Deinococcus sp. LM3]